MAEEKFFHQKSRVQWANQGDRNTAYFHRVVKARNSINQIHYLIDSTGRRLETKLEIQQHVVDYFKNILGTGNAVLSMEEKRVIRSSSKFKCTAEMKAILSKPVTASDIKLQLFSMKSNKTPGPDGYTADFFKRSWDITGDLLSDAVSEFFSSGKMLKQWNATAISLIPKMDEAVMLGDFRPISCCNVVYKIVSGILAKRLQTVLPEMISHNQSAFVKGRLLTENVLLATELIHGFGNSNISSRGLLKVDLKKAFDSINWDFIDTVLEAAEFPMIYKGWIMACITSVTFSIKINGELCGFFKAGKGLRQGDPISPFLFLMAMEILTHILDANFEDGHVGYHPLAKNTKITHLAFADDIMIFFDGKSSSLNGIAEVLGKFSTLSGLSVNNSKTSVFYAGLNTAEADSVLRQGFALGTFPVRYLGLPLLHRKMKNHDFSPLLDSIAAKFNAWTVKYLSFAGRLQLLSSVIYGILNFWLSAFRLPKGCLKRIQMMCNGFLWSGDISKKHHTKISWEKCCLPKAEGGLGLRNFVEWNRALNMKLIWLLFANSGSLWVAWCRDYYLRGHSFWSLNRSPHGSWSWNSLLQLRDISKALIGCRLGNGVRASFWFDNWTGEGSLLAKMGSHGPRRIGLPLHASVSQATDGHNWNITARYQRDASTRALVLLIATINAPTSEAETDVYLWGPEGNRGENFNTKQAWEIIRPRQDKVSWRSVVWSKLAIPKHAFIFWTANYDRLPTRSRIAAWGQQISNVCGMCNAGEETREHLFLQCAFAGHIWLSNHRRLGHRRTTFVDWRNMIEWIRSNKSKTVTTLKTLVAQATVYFIWCERNSRLHSGRESPPRVIVNQIDRSLRDTLVANRYGKGCAHLLSRWFRFS